MYIVFLIMLATASSALISFSYKKGAEHNVDPVASPSLLCTMACLFAAVIFTAVTFISDGGIFFANKLSIAYAALLGISYAFAALFYLIALSCGPFTLSLIFINVSAFMPILYSGIFLGERISAAQGIGLAIILISCVVLSLLRTENTSNTKITAKWVVFIILTFFSNSLFCFASRLNAIRAPETSLLPFSTLTYAIGCFTCFIFFVLSGGLKKKISPRPLSIPALGVAITLSTTIFTSSEIPRFLPSVMQYPFVNGSTIILGALVGRIFFKERLNRLCYICIAVTIGAMFLLGL